MRITPILIFSTLFSMAVSQSQGQQPINGDPTKGYYNVTIPKTPEADGIEQFGKIPVSELTGTPNISIPIYTVKSNFLSAPITLSYHPTGIKVNQEASWVGLGWDIEAGGRITVETRGDIDRWSTNGFTVPSPSTYASGISAIYARLNNSNNQAVLTAGTPCVGCVPFSGCSTCHPPSTVPDDYNTIAYMVELGMGEPDIYRANFMGHSFAFFFDKVTGNLTFKGEQSTFKIQPALNSLGYMDSFVITDDDGVIYYFNQQETTTLTLPANVAQVPTTTSAWLLTKVVHPSGDYLQFNYANFGSSYPMLNMNGFLSAGVASAGNTYSQSPTGGGQNQQYSSPFYLISIQSPDMEADFSLGGRNDLYGPGSQQLNQITIKERQSGRVWKMAKFSYSYFTAAANPYLSSFANYMNVPNIPSGDYLACHNIRLRLDALKINDLPAYQFSYNSTTVDKLSYSQDHWGYYNGASNYSSGANPISLIPYTGISVATNNSTFDGSANRNCDPTAVLAMSLQSIVYPTGGSTSFVFEPHQSSAASFSATGGGLRIKTINNYASTGTLTNSINYSYVNGIYFGALNYLNETYKLATGTAAPGASTDQFTASSNGVMNDNELLIAYPTVTVTQTGPGGQANGKVVKVFNLQTPYSGFDVRPPAWPTNSPNVSTTFYLGLAKKSFPPSPVGNLDGKLMQEQYQDNAGNPIKIVNYYYHQANFSQNFYDIRTVDNVQGGIGMTQAFFSQNGWRATTIFVSPNKTFTTEKDSVVEIDYLNSVPVTNRTYYTYNTRYQLQSEQHFTSDGGSSITAYQYPIDQQGSGGVITQMIGACIFSPILSTTVTRNGSPVSYLNNNYYSPTVNIYVPQNTQVKIGSNPLETRYLYNYYDGQGHLLERQLVNGVKEAFIWGYGQRFLVARVVGSDYPTAIVLVNTGLLPNPPDDATLRTELNKLRTGLPNAQVTSYTYNVFTGLTSQTDPSGLTNYFNYDADGRLAYIQDQHLNVVKRFAYSYSGMADGAADVLSTPLNSTNTTTTAWTATFTSVATGTTTSYPISQGTVPTIFASLAPDIYNVSLSPNNTLTTNAQLIFNGVTYTGTTFSLSNVNANVPNSFNLITGPPFPGSIVMNSGYSAPTEGVNMNGGVVTGHLTWLSHSQINGGSQYNIGVVTNDCVPSANRSFTVVAGGITWTVIVYSNGTLQVTCPVGTTITANTTITFASFSYSI